ncbi:MAG: cytochrome c3 family protein [Desulfitobacteriaceae bacterium]|nr:cytochrome c3 family protein [Desulfitobacteriaceae bacterium]
MGCGNQQVTAPASNTQKSSAYIQKIVTKTGTVGKTFSAGSDECLKCHTKDVGDWQNTPHTQKALKGYDNINGWAANPADYTGAAKWIKENRETYVHPLNVDANKDGKPDLPTGIRAVMTEKPLTFSDKTYGVEDITIIIGSNHNQAYAVWIPGYGNKLLNIRYNGIDSAKPSMGQRTDERVWEGSCIGCHVTGYNPTGLDTAFNGQPYYTSTTPFNLDGNIADLRIGCEACHGPSGEGTHLAGGTTINPAELTQDQQIDICGRCHGNWNTTVPGTTARKDVFNFKPGDSLVELLSKDKNNGVDRIRRPNWGSTDPKAKPFLGNGASNDDHQEWYDFKISAHYLKTDNITCTTCHDPHENNEGAGFGMRILKDLDTAKICATCHIGTNFKTKKGEEGAINPHTTKPYGEGVPKELWRADGKWPWEKK